MGIPNTVLKVIDKHGKVVDFELERIVRSIAASLVDVSRSSKWRPELRALKYAALVRDQVYREFYDLVWLKSSFIVLCLSYQPEERHKRLEHARVTRRLCFVMLQHWLDDQRGTGLEGNEESLREFIAEELRNARVDPHYTDGLFPRLADEEKAEMAAFLFARTVEVARLEVTDELLYPHREFVQDTIEKVLKDLGEVDIAEGYMVYREGRRKLQQGDLSVLQFTNNGLHEDVVNRTISWNVEHECDSVFALNDWILGRHGKDLRELVAQAEARYHEDVRATARAILQRRDELRVVIIAGPSCSNKTTTTVIIGQELTGEGLKLKPLNVDNYFKNRRDQPKDEFGDYDFEMPEAIDLPLLNEQLEALLGGHTVAMPHFDFKTGERGDTVDFRVEQDELILIDCLHGLYGPLTRAVPGKQKFKLYIESMNVIRGITGQYTRWADVRMLKRMIRDSSHRGYDTRHTLAHWPYVRKGELKHIIPYIFSTDVVLNAGIPYELPVLKAALRGKFPTPEFIEQLRQQGRIDPYIRGIRTHNLLGTVEPLADLTLVPGTSPLREFIGGSHYVIPHNE